MGRFLMMQICSVSVPHTRQLSQTSTLFTDNKLELLSRSLTTRWRFAASPSNQEFAVVSDSDVDDEPVAPA